MYDVTIVICTLKKDFYYLSKYPVIIVNPYKNIYDKSNIMFIKDKKEGMGKARNIGLDACDSEYILYMSDDNIIIDDKIESAILYMNNKEWIGTAFQQRIKNPQRYFEECINIRNRNRFKEGEKLVIGTPFIWKTEILKDYRFDDNMKYSDDTDIAERLRNDGYLFGYSPFIAFEGKENAKIRNIIKRFKMYGISDADFYKKYSKKWTLKRKIKSLLHPITAEFIPQLYYFPFYILIVLIRFFNYIKKLLINCK